MPPKPPTISIGNHPGAVTLCGLTAAQALFCRLGVPAPVPVPAGVSSRSGRDPSHISLFINGASTSVSLYAAQLARSSPCPVTLIGTASPKHFAMFRAAPYSYDHMIDYRAPDWTSEVLSATSHEGADLAFDCISEGESVLRSSHCLKETPSLVRSQIAVVRSIEGGAWTASDDGLTGSMKPSYGAVWEGLGTDVEYAGMTLAANPAMRAFSAAFYRWLSAGGLLVPNAVRVMPGGLGRIVEDGFTLLGAGTMGERTASSGALKEYMKPVSGEKLVYRIGHDGQQQGSGQ